MFERDSPPEYRPEAITATMPPQNTFFWRSVNLGSMLHRQKPGASHTLVSM
jgi:hypothetical protein